MTLPLRLLTFDFVRWIGALLVTLMALMLLAAGLGRALPATPGISMEETHGDNTEISLLDVDRSLRVNLTRSPALDFNAAWSLDGTRMAFTSIRDGRVQLLLLTLGTGGGVRRLGDQSIASSVRPVWSPDGKSVVYEVELHNAKDLYIVDVDAPLIPGDNPRPLVVSRWDDRFPVWSPDGSQIAFVSWRTGDAEIFLIHPDGSNLTNLTNDPGWDVSPAWSPDGSQIAFFSLRGVYRQLYVMNRDGSGVRQLTNTQEVNNGNYWGAPVWSPDGQAIAYQSVINGSPKIVVAQVDGSGERSLTDDARLEALPLWLPGERMVYMAGVGAHTALYVVDGDGYTRALTPDDLSVKAPTLWHIP